MECFCKKCHKTWEPRIDHLPKQCPYCKSPRWNEDKRPSKDELEARIKELEKLLAEKSDK